MAEATPALEIRNLHKRYGSLEVLKGISLTARDGDVISILGSSGSGKSTLMNIVGCLDRPTSGSYQLEGKEVATLDESALAAVRNAKLGFVFQNFNLLPRMSALQNVALPLVYANMPKKERLERAAQHLEKVGLGDRMHHRPNELSGGQRQRVAIARALVNDPPILIADEPTGNLDTKSSLEIMDIFTALHRHGRTLIMVTHEPDIAAYALRTIQMRDGQIVQDSQREEEA